MNADKMMNTRLTAHLSLLFTFAMLMLSFSFGFHNYSQTQKAITSDLNQALQRTIMQKTDLWMSRDSIRAYSHLSSIFGNPVAIESYNKEFAEALSFTNLKKEKTGIIIQVKNKNEATDPHPATKKELSADYLASDTIIWLSAQAPGGDSPQSDLGISFQGYASCSPLETVALMDKTLPLVFLLLAMVFGGAAFFLPRSKANKESGETAAGQEISFGNLTLSCNKNCFFKENKDKLKLTPQQYSLMEMFYLSSTHILTRTDICEALWPGKVNADETLNTLVRRLRPLIEENTNLKITTDRGRAYILELQNGNK